MSRDLKTYSSSHTLLFPLLALSQTLDLQLLGGLQEGGELVLGHVHLPCVHKLQDCGQMHEWNILQDDDWVLGWILLQRVLEIWAAGAEDHLMGLGVLAFCGNSHIAERFLVP